MSLEWLPPSSEVWCPSAAGCVDKYLVQRRAKVSDSWVTIGTNERQQSGKSPLRVFYDKTPLAASAQYSVLAQDASGKIGSRFFIDVNQGSLLIN